MTLMRFTLYDDDPKNTSMGDLVVDSQCIGAIVECSAGGEPVAILHLTHGLSRAVVRDLKRTALKRWATIAGLVDEED